MSTYIFIFGNHPGLSVGEIYNRYPEADFKLVTEDYALFELNKIITQEEFDHFGGALKAAEIVDECPRGKLIESLLSVLEFHYTDTMLDYGVSLYGWNEKNLRGLLLDLKKKSRVAGLKTRFINSTFMNVTAAQYKQLRKKGMEILLLKQGDSFLVGKVVGVQDIDAYGARDYSKPYRDMQVGMLPPKLAQVLINLTGSRGVVWDPFCGTGSLVMEGLLMGRDMLGSDINATTLEGCNKNVSWVKEAFKAKSSADIFVHDARRPLAGKSFDAIACEGYLGPPQIRPLTPDQAHAQVRHLDELYLPFFKSLRESGFMGPIVIALPFFKLQGGGDLTLNRTIEKIEELGFARARLIPEMIKEHDAYCLKYSRPDQAVGRAVYKFVALS